MWDRGSEQFHLRHLGISGCSSQLCCCVGQLKRHICPRMHFEVETSTGVSTRSAVTCFSPSAFFGIGLDVSCDKTVCKMLRLLGGWSSPFPLQSGKVEPGTVITEMCAETLHLQSGPEQGLRLRGSG